MSWYTLALFAHIVGVLTLFISMATQWIITLRVRRAGSIAQVREWCGLAKGIGRLAPVTGVLIVGAGIYMTAVAWNMLTSWVDVSIAAMVIMMIFGMGVVGRRLNAIRRAATETSTDAIPMALQARINDPALWVSMQMAVTVALSIVFMMTTKPNLTISVVAVLVSLALGAGIGTMSPRLRRVAKTALLPAKEAGVH